MDMIAIFKGSPTSGSRDGTEVSSDGLMTTPVDSILDRGTNNVQTLAVRCENGYETDAVTLTSQVAWLRLSEDNTTYSDSITLYNVGDTNTLFYAKITAGSTVGVNTGSIRLEADVDVAT